MDRELPSIQVSHKKCSGHNNQDIKDLASINKMSHISLVQDKHNFQDISGFQEANLDLSKGPTEVVVDGAEAEAG